MAIEWKVNRMVVTPDGRVGMLTAIGNFGATVKFGPDGPFEQYKLSSLRYATFAEVVAAELDSVGRDRSMESR